MNRHLIPPVVMSNKSIVRDAEAASFRSLWPHVPVVFVSLVTLSAILRMPDRICHPCCRPVYAELRPAPGRLTGRLLTALFVLRMRKGAHIDVLRLLRRLLEQTIDSHDRRRHLRSRLPLILTRSSGSTCCSLNAATGIITVMVPLLSRN